MIDIDKLSASVPRSENEYIAEDGFLHCQVCGDALELMIEVPERGQRKVRCVCSCKRKVDEREKELKQQEENERNRRRCFGDAKEINCRFDTSKETELIKVSKNYANQFADFNEMNKGLLFYGISGTGKSHAAACIANALIDKGYTACMSTFESMINRLQESFDGRQRYLDSLNDYSLLIIDDLGAERQSNYMQSQVFNIIDARYKSGKPFIITSNLTAAELKKPADISNARRYDRVLEICHPVEAVGESFRRQKLREDYKQMEMLLKG